MGTGSEPKIARAVTGKLLQCGAHGVRRAYLEWGYDVNEPNNDGLLLGASICLASDESAMRRNQRLTSAC
jgi:hypothetical protein